MKNSFKKFILVIACFTVLVSCNRNTGEEAIKEAQHKDSVLKANQTVLSYKELSDSSGIIGIFDVPEMLTICKLDSGPMKDISFKIAKAYGVLEEEMNSVGATLDGMPGMITYSNDTSNFVFECVLPIKDLPKKQPKSCKIVALESSPMLIFNFYGPYEHLFSAYDRIRKYMKANKLKQSGPMREFYLTDPTIEKDPTKWETRIMVPVGKTK